MNKKNKKFLENCYEKTITITDEKFDPLVDMTNKYFICDLDQYTTFSDFIRECYYGNESYNGEDGYSSYEEAVLYLEKNQEAHEYLCSDDKFLIIKFEKAKITTNLLVKTVSVSKEYTTTVSVAEHKPIVLEE